MEQVVASVLGGGGLLAALFVFGRRAFVRWAQENVQINAAEAASEIVIILRQQLDEFRKETSALRAENAEFRKENAELRKEISELRDEIKCLRMMR